MDERLGEDGVRSSCRCGRVFLAAPSMKGRIANCPSCGAAVAVPPGRDPIDRTLFWIFASAVSVLAGFCVWMFADLSWAAAASALMLGALAVGARFTSP